MNTACLNRLPEGKPMMDEVWHNRLRGEKKQAALQTHDGELQIVEEVRG